MDYYLPPLKLNHLNLYEMAKNTVYEKQLHLIPKQVKFCKKCVVSNQRPRIVFNDQGVCNACVWSEEKENIDWKRRKEEFLDLLNKYRKSNGEYDVVVPSSGGKDSGMIAHRLKYEYNMNPIVACWSPLLYTDIGFQNIQNLFSSGISGVIHTPNRKIQRIISLLGLVLIGNHFEAFGRGQMSFPLHVACEYNIPLVMSGENGELEYGGSHKDKDKPGRKWEYFDELYHKGTSTNQLVDFCNQNKILNTKELKDDSLKYFSRPPVDNLKKLNIDFRWFGFYHKWNPQENYYYVSNKYGFSANPEGHSEGTYNKYASLDDATDPLHYYMSYIKFGLGRSTSDAAHEIRDNHITREEGVALVKRYDHLVPQKSLDITLKYLDITFNQLEEICNAYREKSSHLWNYDTIKQKWNLKKTVY